MKRSDITDTAVVAACAASTADRSLTRVNGLRRLMEDTGAPLKVCLAAMERTMGRGLIECGVTLGTAWPTPKGLALLRSTARPPQHWRTVQAARFNARAGLDRPRRPTPYVRPTDAEVAAITDPASKLYVTLGRAAYDVMAPFRESAAARVVALAEHQRRSRG